MSSDPALNIYKRPKLTDATLVVAWQEEPSKLGSRTIDYLKDKLCCSEFAEILPQGFFRMTSIAVENNVAQFPESKFYVSEEHNLVLFKSNMPQNDWYRFLNLVLDVALNECGVSEVFTLGATISASPHTTPRKLFSVVSSSQIKEKLLPTGITGDFDFETLPGQKPSINSYLLWLAREHNMEGACLWVSIPFYLMMLDDPRARKKVVEYFNSYLNLGLDTGDLGEEVASQASKLRELIDSSPEVGSYFHKLETGDGLDPVESEKFAREIVRFLRK